MVFLDSRKLAGACGWPRCCRTTPVWCELQSQFPVRQRLTTSTSVATTRTTKYVTTTPPTTPNVLMFSPVLLSAFRPTSQKLLNCRVVHQTNYRHLVRLERSQRLLVASFLLLWFKKSFRRTCGFFRLLHASGSLVISESQR